ncbi:kinesin-associated protein [Nesidiocoris tenuis]|uniref:Kinesin-associated protein n=1 Tax=Nesidiocoris tenuis TaxID=355587 RepID=A0ABN7ACP0_9HEMI|nr:kinesin-associated protein [Nesidiocoris tenuis]
MNRSGMVHSEDAKYIKRRFWCGSIDVHPTEPALILNYEVEATILSESENPVLSDKKQCQKIIRLKALNKNSDCALLAREVVSKCSLIHPSKIGDVEHLIYFLQSRKENAFAGGYADNGMNNFSGSNGYESPQSNSAEGEKANYANLYQYGDLLYEDLPDKIKGSGLIMQLSLDNDNLEELSRSEAVLSALGRVLREDYKKSIDLCTNILTIFHSFSVFTKFHPLILTYKIGSLSISIIEYELQLYTQWKSDLAFPRGRESAPISRLPVPKSARPASTIIPPARTRSSTPSNDHKRLSLIPAPKSETPPKGPSTPEEETVNRTNNKIAKQDRLLRVNFSLLLNLAENLKVEDKIRKRNIVAMLVQCLDRNSVPLLIVIAKFLTKFSIRAENKDEMANLNVIEKLPKLLQLNNFDLEKATLQLLFNLSFDTNLREKMIRVGFLQKLASLLNDERHLSIILKILYHLSLDDRVKAMFTFTNCLPKLMKMLISFDHKNPDFKILVALSVNVALNSRCAETMCENGCLEHLKQRTLAYRDPLLMKVLRNLSTHASTKSDFLVFADELLQVLPKCPNDDFLLELTGTLANLPLAKLENLSDIMVEYDILKWIQDGLQPGKEDDFALELIMLISTLSTDEVCGDIFCGNNIVSLLIEILKRKQEDDEIVLQIIYTFYQLVHHHNCRNYLINKTIAIDYLIDLMNDTNPSIKKVCDACVEIIKEDDSEYEERVKVEKFQAHNSHWIAMVENKALESSLSTLDSDYRDTMPAYDFNQSFLLNAESQMTMSNLDDIEIISNNPQSDEGSRPWSRYDSEGEEFLDSYVTKKNATNEDAVQNALRNLVIADDADDAHQYYHIGTPNTQVSMT